jgi:ElaB/YqjD/DUF883 family membrane-anchored ribosome-binding protein
MNSSRENDPEAIRSDINVTRARMDNTMDELGDRFQPRHLLDEVLGLFRRSNEGSDGNLRKVREKISHSADAAMHAVVDTVKQNPMPALLIGAGVAWMIYESRRDRSGDQYDEDETYARRRDREGVRYDPDLHYDRPLQYPSGEESVQREWSDQGGSKLGEMKEAISEKAAAAGEQVKEKFADVKEQAREKLGHLKERAGEKLQAARERAGEITGKVGERTREVYSKTRERVTTTADEHPLEVGLVCLAAGVFAGLALPTPNAVNRVAGPAADRLRQRARETGTEMLEKSKNVARAAATAVKEEAKSQGLTTAPAATGDKCELGNQSGSQSGPFDKRPEISGM